MATAITRIYTAEGYVIASDSRATWSSVAERKIFSVRIHGRDFACSFGGTVRFGLPVLFDFTREAPLHLEAVSSEYCPWKAFLTLAGQSLAHDFNQMRIRSQHPPMKDVRDTYVFLDGYNRVGDACSGLLCFEHGENETTQSSKHEWVGPPVSIKRYGSNVLRNLLNIDDPQVAPYASPQQKDVRSIHAATIRANNEILCQCDKEMLALDPDRSSLTIGPPVRMATVTRERGFEWVKGFEPT